MINSFQNGNIINTAGNDRSKQEYVSISKKKNRDSDNADLAGIRLLHFPIGMIVMYEASNTPPLGWAICDGTEYIYPTINGVEKRIKTPDLRMCFVVGPTQLSNNNSITLRQGENNISRVTYQRKMFNHSHLATVPGVSNWESWQSGQSAMLGRPQVTTSTFNVATDTNNVERDVNPTFVSLHYIMRIF